MTEKIQSETPKQTQDINYPHSTSYELFILVLTIFSLLVVAWMILGPSGYATDSILWRVDSFICVIFLIDFLSNLWRAPNKADYFFKQGGWLDLLGSVPASPERLWTALLRFARLNRLVRIIKYLQGKDRDEVISEARRTPAKTALLSIIFATIMLVTVASLMILPLEKGMPGANITSGPNAFWWAFVTVTTVGYGDYTPVTWPGRTLAMVLMTFGIGIFAVLTSFVATRLVALQDDGEDTAVLIRKENAIIRADLAELKELLQQQGSIDNDE